MKFILSEIGEVCHIPFDKGLKARGKLRIPHEKDSRVLGNKKGHGSEGLKDNAFPRHAYLQESGEPAHLAAIAPK